MQNFLRAVESRDPERVAGCFSSDARYANIPHDPAVGTDAIRGLFGAILSRCEAVRWDIVSAAYLPDRAYLERVDRFFIAGGEYAIECNGVFVVDRDAGLLTEVRDYVDLGLWRSRLAAARQ